MNELEEFVLRLSKSRALFCSAAQGLHRKEIKAAQLHAFRGNDAHCEFFALVLSVRNGMCRIMPGSLYAHEAGTGDVVVPRSVMGGCMFLSPTLARNMPIHALGEGFACLDDASFLRAWGSEMGASDGAFRSAFPFVGENDSRFNARRQLMDVMESAVGLVRRDMLGSLSRMPWRRPNPFASRENFVRGYRMAAADSRDPISSTRKLDGFDGSLMIRYLPDAAVLNIRVFDAAGEKSTALDGWGVLGADAAVLGYFDGAVFEAQVGNGFDGGIRFLDLDGNPHDLAEEM